MNQVFAVWKRNTCWQLVFDWASVVSGFWVGGNRLNFLARGGIETAQKVAHVRIMKPLKSGPHKVVIPVTWPANVRYTGNLACKCH